MTPWRLKTLLLPALGLAACAGDPPAPQPPPVPSCGGAGTICTWGGTGLAAFDGDGKAATDTSFYWPMDLEFAPDGRAYVLDWNNHRVRRAAGDGEVGAGHWGQPPR